MWDEKRMMGGLYFMVDEKMLLGVSEDRLMVRLDPEDYESMPEKPGAEPHGFYRATDEGFCMGV